jgi:hypothetical protein
VRSWSKPDDENRSRDITETGNGSTPVVATQKLSLLHTSYCLAIFDQPGTSSAFDNFLIQIEDTLL